MTEPLTTSQAARAGEYYRRFAAAVAGRLEREFPWADPDAVAEAAVEGILDAAHDASAFDPARGSFESFLYWLGREHLRTRLRSEKRLKAREAKKAAESVTPGEPAAPPACDEEPPNPADIRELKDRLARTDAERAALDLWLAGVVSAADMARELGYGTDAGAARRAGTLLARLRQRIHRERQRQQQQREGGSDGRPPAG